MGMTIAEKILARKSGQAKVGPGDLVTVEVDTVVMIDNSFTAGRWRDIQKVRDPDRIVVVFDHRVPASTEDSAAAHRTGRGFVAKFGIKRFHDVGYDQGISHGLFFRNCVNFAFPAVECPGIHRAFEEGDIAEVDFESSTVRNVTTGTTLTGRQIPPKLIDLVRAGSIYPLLEKEGLIGPKA